MTKVLIIFFRWWRDWISHSISTPHIILHLSRRFSCPVSNLLVLTSKLFLPLLLRMFRIIWGTEWQMCIHRQWLVLAHLRQSDLRVETRWSTFNTIKNDLLEVILPFEAMPYLLQGNRSAATSAYQMSLQRSGLPFTQDNVVIYSRGMIYILGDPNIYLAKTWICRRECSSRSDCCLWRRNTPSMGAPRRYPSWYGIIPSIHVHPFSFRWSISHPKSFYLFKSMALTMVWFAVIHLINQHYSSWIIVRSSHNDIRFDVPCRSGERFYSSGKFLTIGN